MNAGKLRHRITLQRRDVTQDAFGAPVDTWTDVATVYASIDPLKGSQLLAAQAFGNETKAKIIIRYRPGITADMRVVFGAKIYDIHEIINPGECNVEIHMICSEGLTNG